MKVKKQKTFELSSIKKYKQYEHKIWWIPIACLMFTIICPGGQKDFQELVRNPGIGNLIGFILYCILGTMVLSVIPFFIAKIKIRTERKIAIQNCTIESIQDFDYYREKLTGLSPAVISILTDLEIEQRKDVAASILQYENLGLLIEEADHTYRATEKYDRCKELNESDRYLIEHLEKGDFDWENDTKWKQLVMNEAVSEGYITRREWLMGFKQGTDGLREKKDDSDQKKAGSNKGCLGTLVAVLVWFVWGVSALPRLQVFGTGPEKASLTEQVNFLAQPEVLPACIEALALFLYTMFLVSYVIAFPKVIRIMMKNMKSIKRTDYGNQMAECVYGMKNFIHDYSNLNEADRRQVVLWEDYLVYAVVLEENEEIVNEIAGTRRDAL